MAIRITEYKNEDRECWDRYVQKNDGATFFHLIGWKNTIERTYKHKSYYLIAKDDGQILGILPMFLIKSFSGGKSLVSLPFCPFGGVCADNQEIEKDLVKYAIEFGKKIDVSYCELRHFYQKDLELKEIRENNTLILELNNDVEKVWKGFKAEVRNQVRKAEKSGLIFKSGNEYLKQFYKVYSRNMRDIGSPTHSIGLFKNLLKEFRNETRIFIVEKDDKAIGGMFAVFYKNTVCDLWASSLRSYFRFCPNNLLYWGAIRHSSEKGYKYFDFGRSQKDSGTFKFKKQWGTVPVQLHYYYYLHKIKKIPALDQSSLTYRLFSNFWMRLPLFFTNLLGPMIRKGIG